MQAAFRKKYFHLGVITTCLVVMYYDVIAAMITDWSTNDNYSHGFLIPFISGYLIWRDKNNLSKIPIQPTNAGLFFLGGGLSLFVVSHIGAEFFTMRLSILIVLLGLAIFIGGWKLAKSLSLPVGYLIFMIPLPGIIWNKIAFPLKLFATKISVTAIESLGIPVFRDGNIIQLANTSLEVVDACSGLRSLTSLLALSAAFALVSQHSKGRKCVLFFSAVPIAILLNIFRLSITAVLAQYFGEQVAQGFLHEISGILVFALAFMLLWTFHRALQNKRTEKYWGDSGQKARRSY